MSLSRDTISFAGGLLLLILPLVFLPGMFNQYEFPKFVLFVSGVQALAVMYAFRSFSRGITLRWDALTIAVIGYGTVVLLADIFGVDPKISLLGSMWRHQGFVTLLSGILLFLVLRSSRRDRADRLLDVIGTATFVSALLVCSFALFQAVRAYTLNDLSVPTYQGRIVGTLGNPNFLGGYLAATLPFVWYDSTFLRRVFPRLALRGLQVALTLATVSVIVFSASRSAMLALVVVLLLYFVRFVRSFSFGKKVAILFIGAFLSSLVLLGYQTNRGWFMRESYWENRMIIWTYGLKAVFARPILGYGQENFELVFPPERKMKVDSAHNLFLEVAVSSGFVGLSIFAVILTLVLRRARFPVRVSLVAFLVGASFNPLSIAQLALVWSLLALVL